MFIPLLRFPLLYNSQCEPLDLTKEPRIPHDVTSLDLSSRGIEIVPSGVFNHLRECYSLDLSGNGIHSLMPGCFDGLLDLEYLKISYNNLSWIPDNIFQNLYKCRSIELQYNRIQEVKVRDP